MGLKEKVSRLTFLVFIFTVLAGMIFTNAYAGILKNNKDINSAKLMVKEYKTKLYNIPDYENYKSLQPDEFIAYIDKVFKPYFSEKGYKRFVNNRVPVMYGDAFINTNKTIKLKSISFCNITEDKKKQEIVMDYTISVIFSTGGKSGSFKENGQVTIKKQKNKLLIDNDYINVSKELMNLSLQSK